MKAQRRHELHENILARELLGLRDFFNRYGNWVAGAILAVGVIGLIIWLVHSRSIKQVAEEGGRLGTFSQQLFGPKEQSDAAATGLAQMAESAKEPMNGAQAAVTLGDFYSELILWRQAQGQAAEAQGEQTRARRYYDLVLSKYGNNKLFAARARYGLGLLDEDDGNFASAQQQYQMIEGLVGEANPIGLEAKGRLLRMKNWTQPVRLAATLPASLPAAATAPATSSAPAKAPATAPATAP